MSTCRYDSDREDYLVDGESCRHDEYGDVTKHCTARKTCSNHVGWRELTCARCVGRTRQHIRTIVDLYPLTAVQALDSGVNSEAANLAGPAANPLVFAARRTIGRDWIYANISQPARGWCEDAECPRRHFKTSTGDRWHKRGIENAIADLLDDDDEFHPYGVLTRWHLMLAEDYGHHLPDVMSVSDSGAYLERMLPRMAHDDGQDFPLFARELRKVQNHLESVIRNSHQAERGAPCPDCKDAGKVVRMSREYGHWCIKADCEQIHYLDESGDRWVCPANKAHWMTAEGYAEWLKERSA